MGTVHNFQPATRAAEPQACDSNCELRFFQNLEADAAIRYLRDAALMIETATATGLGAREVFVAAIPDAKAGLFHLLTLAGCREVDRPIRDALRQR